MREFHRLFTAVLGLSSVMGCSSSDDAPLPDEDPAVEMHACVDLPLLPTAQCGSLTAPFDRADPGAGTTQIEFALIPRSDTSSAARGTVVPNPGGPGTSTIALAGALYAEALAPLREHWDLLLIDPRGVGRSERLVCATLADPTRVFGSIDEQRSAIGACGAELGAKARYYGTAAVADDFDDIRAGLGIAELDLLGDSYGTFLMTVYAQRHPEHVRSVVLSGAYAVDRSTDAVTAQAVDRAMRLIGERTGAYDGAAAVDDLAAVAAQLRQQPDTVEVEYGGQRYSLALDERRLASAVGKLYTGQPNVEGSAALASAVHAARGGDASELRAVVQAHLVTAADVYADPEFYFDAVNWAAACHDYARAFRYADDAATRRAAFARYVAGQASADFGAFSASAWLNRDIYDSGACLDWHNDTTAGLPFAAGTKLADLPVLVLSGDLDANTPSPQGQEAAAQFPHATWMEVMNAGHTPSETAEGQRLIMDFISHAR